MRGVICEVASCWRAALKGSWGVILVIGGLIRGFEEVITVHIVPITKFFEE